MSVLRLTLIDFNYADDFKPNQCSDDDEETIAKAEEEMNLNHEEEVELLKKESELPLEDLLKELPPNYLEERDKSLSPFTKEVIENVMSHFYEKLEMIHYVSNNLLFCFIEFRKVMMSVGKMMNSPLIRMLRQKMRKILSKRKKSYKAM